MRYTVNIAIEPILNMNYTSYLRVYRYLEDVWSDISDKGVLITPYTTCHCNTGLDHLTVGDYSNLLAIF